jgi:acyl dehydratase
MDTIELDSAPSLASLYARAVSASILPGSRSALPDRRLVLRGVELERERVAAYSRVCGFGARSEIPATYPHVLAFPLHLSLMAERSFPFPALGLVHIANAIDLCAPIPVGDTLDLTVWAADLRPHDRGRQFDFHAEASLEDSLVWREVSTYLRRESSDSSSRRSERANEDWGAGLTLSADWSVPGDIGRRYADASGDRNPIHLHPLLARPFGFPTAIAHGMWTKARCLAAFDGWLPPAFTIETEFKSPLRIPGKARLWSGRRGGGWAFRVESPDGERTHAVGSISAEPHGRSASQ